MNVGGTNTRAILPIGIQTLRILTQIALICICGCQSNGYRKGDVTSKMLHRASLDLQAQSRAIDATVEALNDMVGHPATDLKPQFKRFSTALDRLSTASGRAEAVQRQMEEKGGRYFAAWDERLAGINYGVIREQSENRFSHVTNRFYSLNSRYGEAQGVVRPLIKYFTDIRTALSVDLTTAGLDSVRSIAANAEQNSRKVQTELGRLSDELALSGDSMSSIMQASSNPDSATRTSVRSETPADPSARAGE